MYPKMAWKVVIYKEGTNEFSSRLRKRRLIYGLSSSSYKCRHRPKSAPTLSPPHNKLTELHYEAALPRDLGPGAGGAAARRARHVPWTRGGGCCSQIFIIRHVGNVWTSLLHVWSTILQSIYIIIHQHLGWCGPGSLGLHQGTYPGLHSL